MSEWREKLNQDPNQPLVFTDDCAATEAAYAARGFRQLTILNMQHYQSIDDEDCWRDRKKWAIRFFRSPQRELL